MSKENKSSDLKIEKNTSAAKEEECNEFYTRKQQPLENSIAGDSDARVAGSDDSFAESRNYDREAGPRIPGNWGRFGR